IDDILDYSERRIRKKISEIREGSYEAEDYLESTGTEDKPVRLKVRVQVKGDEISFDYSGTDPQVNGPVNAVLGVTLAGIYYVLMCITDPTIPMNEGCFRPVSVNVPRGCVLNPVRPAPVGGGNVETSQRNVDVLFKALSKAIPQKVCAAGQGTMNNVCVGGIDASGKQWVFYETIGGGYGGRQGLDGVDGVQVHMTNTMNTPIEAIEASYPVLFLRYELRKDSCGAGKWRGGCGIVRSWKLLGERASLSLMAERHKIAPWGLFGGKPGATGRAFIIKPDGSKLELPSKCTVTMERGDIFVILTPGGGGYGDPREREQKAILRDFENELLSKEKIVEDYGFNPL
ncbi:MAG: hydantoinase B/oxoprolinase family protein, partial [Thermoproteota archaeon]